MVELPAIAKPSGTDVASLPPMSSVEKTGSVQPLPCGSADFSRVCEQSCPLFVGCAVQAGQVSPPTPDREKAPYGLSRGFVFVPFIFCPFRCANSATHAPVFPNPGASWRKRTCGHVNPRSASLLWSTLSSWCASSRLVGMFMATVSHPSPHLSRPNGSPLCPNGFFVVVILPSPNIPVRAGEGDAVEFEPIHGGQGVGHGTRAII